MSRPPSTVKSALFIYPPALLLSNKTGPTISSGLPGRPIPRVSIFTRSYPYASHAMHTISTDSQDDEQADREVVFFQYDREWMFGGDWRWEIQYERLTNARPRCGLVGSITHIVNVSLSVRAGIHTRHLGWEDTRTDGVDSNPHPMEYQNNSD